MHVKYLNPLAQIRDHYDHHIFWHMEHTDKKLADIFLETQGVTFEDEAALREEYDALSYMVSCQNMFSITNKDLKKPSIQVMNRALERHLGVLERIHNCHAYNVNKHPLVVVRKRYKACRHYLFKFTQRIWYEKLPTEILTLENKMKQKYGNTDLENEAPLPIPEH